jgi:peptidoglycan/LPS O-acetylase OafA/YrhL
LEDEKKVQGRVPEGPAAQPSASRGRARKPAFEDSRGKRAVPIAGAPRFIARIAAAGPVAWIVLALGLGAAVLMVMTELSTIQSVRIGNSTCGAAEQQLRNICHTSGGEQHNWALLVLGVFTALLSFGAAVGRSRPAAVAIFVVGLIVLAIALIGDRPTLGDKRGLEIYYGEAGTRGIAGGGYTLELIGGALAVVAGALGFARVRPRASESREPRRRPADSVA